MLELKTLILFLLLVISLKLSITSKTTKTYSVIKIKKLNWHAAFQDCQSRGLRLATINSKEEQHQIEDLIKNTSMQRHWLWTSGTDQGEEGHFFWMSTGDPFVYTNWSPSQPNNALFGEGCVHIWSDDGPFKWNDLKCSDQLFYICEDNLKNCDCVQETVVYATAGTKIEVN